MKWLRAALLAGAALAVSCIIVADPDFKPPEPEVIPQPTPPEFVPIPFPMPGGGNMRIAQLWFVRLDPGSSALASSYANMLSQAKAAFEASGATNAATAIFALQDARLLWANSLADGGTAPVSVEEALRYYAAQPWDAGTPKCAAPVVYNAARDIRTMRGTYPLELVPWVPPDAGADAGEDGGVFDAGSPVPLTVWPFLTDINAVFIGIVDPGPRPYAYFDGECFLPGGRPPAEGFTEFSPLNWIRSGEVRFFAPQVAWQLIATSEDAGSSAMKVRCLTYPNFPRTALDVISASPRALYTPWSTEAKSYTSVVESSDFCQAAAGEWKFGEFVNNWATALGGTKP